MSTRKIQNLIVTDEDLIVYGDLEVTKKIVIENGCSLVVSGSLTIVINENGNTKIEGNISAARIKLMYGTSSSVTIDGDIFAAYKLNSSVAITCKDLHVHGDIETFTASPIKCKNYFVGGNNDSCSVIAEEEIRILGSSNSFELVSKIIHIEKDCDLNSDGLIAFETAHIGGPIFNCSHLSVGD